ncbi:hypothetical protein HRbin40_00428 [bacterium HR40]|nr:hypothetical protein HRbin40_00428 [bacterium HR40]
MTAAILLELLVPFVRWLHIAAAAVWFGTTLRGLTIRDRLEASGWRTPVLLAEGGQFYALEMRPGPEPRSAFLPLRWSAYFTCLAGYLLLAEGYWLEPLPRLMGADGPFPESWMAVATAAAVPIVGYLLYELLCRLAARLPEPLAAAVFGIALVATGRLLLAIFVPRAAFVHLGVLLATCMAANVGHHFAPCERKLAELVAAGRPPSHPCRQRAALRLRHNAYAMPVALALMMAGRMPLWLPPASPTLFLSGLVLTGFAIADLLAHRRHRPRRARLAAMGLFLGLLAIIQAALPPSSIRGPAAEPPQLSDVFAVIQRRCLACHSQAAPRGPAGGLALDRPEAVAQNARAVAFAAGYGASMPPGNLTGIDVAERALLRRFFESGTAAGGEDW